MTTFYWGVMSNGTWTGMIGNLVSKKADAGISACTLTSPRVDIVEFLVPVLDSR